MQQIQLYGADWCEDTTATRHQLERLGIDYRYINIDQDEQAKAWIKQQNNGKQQTPTLNINGQILIEPDERELEEVLEQNGLMS